MPPLWGTRVRVVCDLVQLVRYASPDGPAGLRRLVVSDGPAGVREMAHHGLPIFLDLKLHDIGNTVARGVEIKAVTGGETSLDKAVLDRLSEPLLHLVSNAVAHGLERPEERARAELARLRVPTAIVGGTDDPFFPLTDAHWLRDTIPGAGEVVQRSCFRRDPIDRAA